ncbi:MAG: hypothetical protein JSW55_04330, partial [Chloroflexota bacterium]
QFFPAMAGLLVNEQINQQLFGAAGGKGLHAASASLHPQLTKDAHLKLRHRPINSSLVPQGKALVLQGKARLHLLTRLQSRQG